MTVDNIHLLAGAYALNALPVEEHAFYERHLATCDACRLEVAEYAETAATLGVAAAEQPPAHLRERVLAAADTTRQVSPVPPEGRGSERSRPFLAAAAAGLAAAVIGLAGLSTYLYGENRQLEATLAQTGLPAMLARGEMVPLSAPEGVAARFVHSDDADRGMLVVDGLPELDATRDYQLWLFHDGTPVPAGVFRVGSDGSVMFEADAQVRGAEVVAVTEEPAGGLDSPSGEPLLVADL